MKGIADTGFLVAFLSDNDRYHDWAVSISQEQTEPFLTCESVLSEAAFHVNSSAAVLDLIHREMIEVAFDCNKHFAQLEALAKRYADQEPDLADLCLIRMSELHPRHKIITIDREDFSIYRRNKREAIPLLCPPVD